MKTNNRIKWMISLSFILFIPSTNIAQNAVQAPQTNYAYPLQPYGVAVFEF